MARRGAHRRGLAVSDGSTGRRTRTSSVRDGGEGGQGRGEFSDLGTDDPRNGAAELSPPNKIAMILSLSSTPPIQFIVERLKHASKFVEVFDSDGLVVDNHNAENQDACKFGRKETFEFPHRESSLTVLQNRFSLSSALPVQLLLDQLKATNNDRRIAKDPHDAEENRNYPKDSEAQFPVHKSPSFDR